MPSSVRRPTVILDQGKYLGTTLEGPFPQCLEAYYNIPYAESTAGVNRFRPPVPLKSSSTSFDASCWGQRPPSMSMMADMEVEGEHCLNLNVFKPRGYSASSQKKLPVMVMFNGGAFNMGSAKSRQISSMIGWSKEPILGVSFNYRVGALGFLSSKLMAKEGCLNVGLKDQALLLKWISYNIGAFGGNPEEITLIGYSAGAHSIGHHLLNPYKTRDSPFHRVILESGAPTARVVYPASAPINELQFKDLLTELNLVHLEEHEIFPILQRLPFERIRDASTAVFKKYSSSIRWPFQPVIDGPGGIIPIAPIRAWQSGNWFKIPIITGFCTNEGSMFVPQDMKSNEQFTSFFRTLLPDLDESDLKAIEMLYPDPITSPDTQYRETRSGLGEQYKRIEAAYGQWAYIAPIRQTCHIIDKCAKAGQHVPSTWLYEFGVTKIDALGAKHSDHIQHTDHMPIVTKASLTHKRISSNMHAYWTSFIATGDPNAIAGDRPRWEKYQEDNRGIGKKMVFGSGNNEIAGGEDRGIVSEMKSDEWAKAEAEFWWRRVPSFVVETIAKL